MFHSLNVKRESRPTLFDKEATRFEKGLEVPKAIFGETIAFGNSLSGVVMCVGTTSSQHSLEHALSAYHQDLPHGAGLIMLSKAYFFATQF